MSSNVTTRQKYEKKRNIVLVTCKNILIFAKYFVGFSQDSTDVVSASS